MRVGAAFAAMLLATSVVAAEPAAAPDPFALVPDALDTGDFVGEGV